MTNVYSDPAVFAKESDILEKADKVCPAMMQRFALYWRALNRG